MPWTLLLVAFLLVLIGLAVYDLVQRRHAILKNFPIIGHFRYWLEAIGPELRQYIVTNNDEERPFSRDQRRWVYASSKQENDYFGFGTDNDLENSGNYLVIRHSAFPLPNPIHGDPDHDPHYRIPCAKVMGGHRQRRQAFRPPSVVNISGMSFGSLSGPAVEAMNRGAAIAGCLHNTGEGGISPYHRKGGELIWQIGTGYFGCRDLEGHFDRARFLEAVEEAPVRAVEIKLSQGAKPGVGGLLPQVKITPEIARIRLIPMDRDCASPAKHTAFDDLDGLLDFVEDLADVSGLPVGIKSAVGDLEFWRDLARLMATTNRGVDFINIDGGEGGTGAAPLAFADHVALPFRRAFASVYPIFVEHDLARHVVFGGAGRLGFPERAAFAFALGCDLVNVGREAMLAVGCIQAQRCHTDHCPTGVATQNRWLIRGLDPTLKAARTANYIAALRKELLRLCRACGVAHPALLTSRHFEILDDRFGGATIEDLFGYDPAWSVPDEADVEQIEAIMRVRIESEEQQTAIA